MQVQNYDYKRNNTFRLAKHDEHIVESYAGSDAGQFGQAPWVFGGRMEI